MAYILDSDEKRVRDFSEKFGAKPIGSIEDVPWNEVDGVFVATMTCDHVRFARPFVERAIPTFVDKTISPIFNEGKALIDLAKEKNVPFLSGSARRFSPAFASLVNESKTEGFGKPLIASRFEPHGISPGHWQERRETSGGFIKNFGVHCVDNLVQIFGSDVKQVNCLSGKFLNQNAESEDSAVESGLRKFLGHSPLARRHSRISGCTGVNNPTRRMWMKALFANFVGDRFMMLHPTILFLVISRL